MTVTNMEHNKRGKSKMEKKLVEKLVKMHRLQLNKDERLATIFKAEDVMYCCDEDLFLEMLGEILQFTKEETEMLSDYYIDYVMQLISDITLDDLFDCVGEIRDGKDITQKLILKG